MATEAQIADSLRKYVHRVPYRWAGANPRGWDCSGAVNYCLCHDLRLPIPGYRGGTFNGSVHGPATGGWMAWSGLREIPRAKCNVGTIVIWPTHMGIAVGPNYYVSAFDTQLGTVIEPIHGGGPIGETARFFQLRNIGGGGAGGGGKPPPPPHGPIPGGNPQSGSAWNAMQAAWTAMRHQLGPGQQAHINNINGQIVRANRITRS